MISTTMMAGLLLLGQAPVELRVDGSYVAKPGDRAVLGLYRRAQLAGGRREPVLSADCYSTIERMREHLEIDIDGSEALLDREPESSSPRAGTAALVTEARDLTYSGRRGEEQSRVLRVQVLDGEFKGRSFYVSSYCVLRFVDADGNPVGPEAIAKAMARRSKPPAGRVAAAPGRRPRATAEAPRSEASASRSLQVSR